MGGKLKEQNREKSPKKDIETEAKREQFSAIGEKINYCGFLNYYMLYNLIRMLNNTFTLYFFDIPSSTN